MAKLAMPRDEEFLKGVRFAFHPDVRNNVVPEELNSRTLDHEMPLNAVQAEHDGRIVGHIQWVPSDYDDGDPVIDYVYVHSAYRRHGLATALLDEARKHEPNLQHDWGNLSPEEGEPWAHKVGAPTGQRLKNLRDQLRKQVGPDRSTIVHKFDDGWAIHKLNTYGDLFYEGKMMRNCLRDITKSIACPTCAGDMYAQCAKCSGDGELFNANGTSRTCRNCNGQGWTSCKDCKGTGMLKTNVFDKPYQAEDVHEVAGDDGHVHSLRDQDNISHLSFVHPANGKHNDFLSIYGRANTFPHPVHQLRLLEYAHTQPHREFSFEHEAQGDRANDYDFGVSLTKKEIGRRLEAAKTKPSSLFIENRDYDYEDSRHVRGSVQSSPHDEYPYRSLAVPTKGIEDSLKYHPFEDEWEMPISAARQADHKLRMGAVQEGEAPPAVEKKKYPNKRNRHTWTAMDPCPKCEAKKYTQYWGKGESPGSTDDFEVKRCLGCGYSQKYPWFKKRPNNPRVKTAIEETRLPDSKTPYGSVAMHMLRQHGNIAFNRWVHAVYLLYNQSMKGWKSLSDEELQAAIQAHKHEHEDSDISSFAVRHTHTNYDDLDGALTIRQLPRFNGPMKEGTWTPKFLSCYYCGDTRERGTSWGHCQEHHWVQVHMLYGHGVDEPEKDNDKALEQHFKIHERGLSSIHPHGHEAYNYPGVRREHELRDLHELMPKGPMKEGSTESDEDFQINWLKAHILGEHGWLPAGSPAARMSLGYWKQLHQHDHRLRPTDMVAPWQRIRYFHTHPTYEDFPGIMNLTNHPRPGPRKEGSGMTPEQLADLRWRRDNLWLGSDEAKQFGTISGHLYGYHHRDSQIRMQNGANEIFRHGASPSIVRDYALQAHIKDHQAHPVLAQKIPHTHPNGYDDFEHFQEARHIVKGPMKEGAHTPGLTPADQAEEVRVHIAAAHEGSFGKFHCILCGKTVQEHRRIPISHSALDWRGTPYMKNVASALDLHKLIHQKNLPTTFSTPHVHKGYEDFEHFNRYQRVDRPGPMKMEGSVAEDHPYGTCVDRIPLKDRSNQPSCKSCDFRDHIQFWHLGMKRLVPYEEQQIEPEEWLNTKPIAGLIDLHQRHHSQGMVKHPSHNIPGWHTHKGYDALENLLPDNHTWRKGPVKEAAKPFRKEYQAVRDEAVSQGWRVMDKGEKGQMLYPPDQKKKIVTWHHTTSDHRAFQNFISEMRRQGLEWPPPRRGTRSNDPYSRENFSERQRPWYDPWEQKIYRLPEKTLQIQLHLRNYHSSFYAYNKAYGQLVEAHRKQHEMQWMIPGEAMRRGAQPHGHRSYIDHEGIMNPVDARGPMKEGSYDEAQDIKAHIVGSHEKLNGLAGRYCANCGKTYQEHYGANYHPYLSGHLFKGLPGWSFTEDELLKFHKLIHEENLPTTFMMPHVHPGYDDYEHVKIKRSLRPNKPMKESAQTPWQGLASHLQDHHILDMPDTFPERLIYIHRRDHERGMMKPGLLETIDVVPHTHQGYDDEENLAKITRIEKGPRKTEASDDPFVHFPQAKKNLVEHIEGDHSPACKTCGHSPGAHSGTWGLCRLCDISLTGPYCLKYKNDWHKNMPYKAQIKWHLQDHSGGSPMERANGEEMALPHTHGDYEKPETLIHFLKPGPMKEGHKPIAPPHDDHSHPHERSYDTLWEHLRSEHDPSCMNCLDSWTSHAGNMGQFGCEHCPSCEEFSAIPRFTASREQQIRSHTLMHQMMGRKLEIPPHKFMEVPHGHKDYAHPEQAIILAQGKGPRKTEASDDQNPLWLRNWLRGHMGLIHQSNFDRADTSTRELLGLHEADHRLGRAIPGPTARQGAMPHAHKSYLPGELPQVNWIQLPGWSNDSPPMKEGAAEAEHHDWNACNMKPEWCPACAFRQHLSEDHYRDFQQSNYIYHWPIPDLIGAHKMVHETPGPQYSPIYERMHRHLGLDNVDDLHGIRYLYKPEEIKEGSIRCARRLIPNWVPHTVLPNHPQDVASAYMEMQPHLEAAALHVGIPTPKIVTIQGAKEGGATGVYVGRRGSIPTIAVDAEACREEAKSPGRLNRGARLHRAVRATIWHEFAHAVQHHVLGDIQQARYMRVDPDAEIQASRFEEGIDLHPERWQPKVERLLKEVPTLHDGYCNCRHCIYPGKLQPKDHSWRSLTSSSKLPVEKSLADDRAWHKFAKMAGENSEDISKAIEDEYELPQVEGVLHTEHGPEYHCWNEGPDGKIVDASRHVFSVPEYHEGLIVLDKDSPEYDKYEERAWKEATVA